MYVYFVRVYTSLFSMKIKYNITAEYYTNRIIYYSTSYWLIYNYFVFTFTLRRLYQSLSSYWNGSSAQLLSVKHCNDDSGHAFRFFVGFRILSVFSVSLLRMWLREPCESERDLDAPPPAQGQSFRDRLIGLYLKEFSASRAWDCLCFSTKSDLYDFKFVRLLQKLL